VTADADLAEALARFAARDRVLVALDFDGTLAPFVDDPDAAAALPRALDAVRELTRRQGTSVAVVSGRSLGRLSTLLGSVGPVALVGSHGAEVQVPAAAGEADADALDAGGGLDAEEKELLAGVRDAVSGIVRAHPGTTLEEKPAAVVLHTRRADRATALAATGAALLGPARWDGVHTLAGKEVVELAVTDVTKGGALRRLRAGLGLDRGGVLYAGDDTTDELAFAALDDDAGDLTVKVGAGPTGARHRVDGPDALADLLVDLSQRRRRGP
jgi:trehalose 6-phosphate phosphatase